MVPVLAPVSVPAPFPVPAPGFGTGSRLIYHSFSTTKLARLMLEAALFPGKLKKLGSNFRFFDIFITFHVGSGSISGYGSGTRIH